MNISGKQVLRAPAQMVWETFIDPEALRNSVPGISEFNEVGTDVWDAVVSMGVGAIKGTYTVNIKMTDKVVPSHYKLIVSGKGKPGWVEAEGFFDMVDQGEKTELSYNLDAKVGGLVAAVGQRMLGGVAKMVFKQFFDNMEKMMLKKIEAGKSA